MSRRLVGKSIGAALLIAVGLVANASAQGSKIGLVDTRSLITQSAAGKEILAKLDKLANEKSAQLKSRQDEIQALQKRIADARVSLSDDKIAELERSLEEKTVTARRLREDLQKQMEAAQAEAFGEFERKLSPLVEQFGREQGYTFILNVGFFNQPNLPSGLVWADASADVTAELIRKLDAATPAAAP